MSDEPHIILDVCKEKFKVVALNSKRLWAVWVTIVTVILATVAALYAVSESKVGQDVFEKSQERSEKYLEAAQNTRDTVIRIETQVKAIQKTLNGEDP